MKQLWDDMGYKNLQLKSQNLRDQASRLEKIRNNGTALISLLHNRSTAKQCWFAEDATGAGPLEEVKQWWDELREAGPPVGCYPNSKKCWLVVKPEKEGRAKEMFAGTGINITTEGRKHLGAALGSRSYLEQYVGGKVEDWVGEVTRLAEFARSQPQASYAAFTFGLRHRRTYFMRTLPDIENLLQPLERAISDVLIPSLIGRNCSEAERDLVALPVRMGKPTLSIRNIYHFLLETLKPKRERYLRKRESKIGFKLNIL